MDIEFKSDEKMGGIKDVELLNFKLLNSSYLTKDSELLEKTYRFWKKAWVKTFSDLNVNKNCQSDDFLNKEIGGLFLGDEPVGLLMYHFIDLEKPYYLDSSYFNNYPRSLMSELPSLKGRTMIITYMTLQKEWRSRLTNYPISELLISFSVLRFMESGADRILGYFRKNRGTQDMFYRHGGEPLVRNVKAYNVDVDFAVINKGSAHLSDKGNCHVLALKKWQEYKKDIKGENNANIGLSEGDNGSFFRSDKNSPLGKRKVL